MVTGGRRSAFIAGAGAGAAHRQPLGVAARVRRIASLWGWRQIVVQRRRFELFEDRPKRRQPRRERVAVIVDCGAEKPREGCRLVVGQVKVHDRVI
jgi:hypothetical protein